MSGAPLTQSEQDLLGAMARFVERRAESGVYLNQGISKSLGKPVLFLCAIGEQALALQRIIDANTVQESLIIPGTAAHSFANDKHDGKR